MLRPSIALLPALAALGLLGGCDKQKPPQPQAERTEGQAPAPQPMGRVDISHRGEPMPAAAFTAPDGAPAALTRFAGRPLMVNLWATWCAPCILEMPTLDTLAGREADRFRLIVVSQDIAGRQEVDPFFAKAGFAHLEPYLDSGNALMAALGTDTLPTTIFYDAQGREQWRVLGNMDWAGERARTLIDGALAPAGGASPRPQ